MRHGARLEQGAEPALVPLVDGEQGLAEHQRRRDQQVRQEQAVGGRETRAEAHTAAGVEQGREKGPGDGTRERAPREALDAAWQQGREEEAAGDDAAVVQQRRRCGGAEAPARQQGGVDDAAGDEEHLGGKDDARQPCGQGLRRRVEARKLQRHQRLGVPPEDGGRHGGQRRQRAQYRREEAVRAVVVTAGQVSGVERHEGDRQRATGEQVVEQVGDLEGGVVGVRRRTRAHSIGEQRLARVAEQARQQHARRQQQRRGADAARLRRLSFDVVR